MMKRQTKGRYDPAARLKKKQRAIEKEKRLKGLKSKVLKRMGVSVTSDATETKTEGKDKAKRKLKAGKQQRFEEERNKQKEDMQFRKRALQVIFYKLFCESGLSSFLIPFMQAKQKERKESKSKHLYKRTKKGQPIMKHKLESILSKI